jgi:hypothetical protein
MFRACVSHRLAAWTVLVLMFGVLGCTRDNGVSLQAIPPDEDLAQPPEDLGAMPQLAGDEARVFALPGGSTARTEIGAAALAYHIAENRWQQLPAPPQLSAARMGWTGTRLVVVGLQGCQDDDCETGRVVWASLAPDEDEWGEPLEIESDIESKFFSATWLGESDDTAYFALGYDIAAIDPNDNVQLIDGSSIAGAWAICLADYELLAVAPASTLGDEGTAQTGTNVDPTGRAVPTPANASLYRRPISEADEVAWEEEKILLSDGTAAGDTWPICTASGVVLVDRNASALLEYDGGTGRWEAHAAAGAPNPPFATAVLANGVTVVNNNVRIVRLSKQQDQFQWQELANFDVENLQFRSITVAGPHVYLWSKPLDTSERGNFSSL